MKYMIRVALVFIVFAVSVAAQKTGGDVAKQIKTLKAEKTITLTYDAASKTSKLMVIAGNFDAKEASKAGVQAMNFGMACFYPGEAITTPPESFNLTFWVMSKKPAFSTSHAWMMWPGSAGALDLGDSRYVSKAGEGMEYLNFKISRADLAKIAASTDARFKLGMADFTFTPEHLTIFRNLLAISDKM